MSMTLSHSHTIRAILDTTDKFTERELKKTVRERDAYPYAPFPESLVKSAGQAGLTYLSAPEENGGCGLPTETWALVVERIAETDAGFAASLLAHALAGEAILRTGSDKIKTEWLGTEPVRWLAYPLYIELDTPEDWPVVAKQGNFYFLSGISRHVANAPVAAGAVIAASLEDGPALFLVPLGEDTRAKPVETLGLRSCPVGHIDLVDVALPTDHVLVRGEPAIRELHELFYPSAAGILIGTLRSSLAYAMEYGKERYQGGQTISEHSQLRMMYGRMAVEDLALRQAWQRVMEEGEREAGARLAVKALAAELAVRATMDGVQLLGGYGYTMEYPQERRLRDARQASKLLGSPTRQRLALVETIMAGK